MAMAPCMGEPLCAPGLVSKTVVFFLASFKLGRHGIWKDSKSSSRAAWQNYRVYLVQHINDCGCKRLIAVPQDVHIFLKHNVPFSPSLLRETKMVGSRTIRQMRYHLKRVMASQIKLRSSSIMDRGLHTQFKSSREKNLNTINSSAEQWEC